MKFDNLIDSITSVVPSNLKNKNYKELCLNLSNDSEKDHNCWDTYGCHLSSIHGILSENNYTDSKTINKNYIGGVSSAKKRHSKTTSCIKLKNDIFDMKSIGESILEEIITLYPFIYQNNSIDDNKLIETIYRILKEKSVTITQLEFDLLLRYIRENIFPTLKTKIIKKHPLLDIIKNEDYMSKIYLMPQEQASYNHVQMVAITKAMSAEWNGLQDLLQYNDRRIYLKKDAIDPLFMLLYANKLPGFEDLTILQDYPTLIEEVKHNNFNKDNLTLLFLRISDPNLLHTINNKHLDGINNENLRISISILLRELAYSIRSGTFENKSSALLLNILKEFKMPTAKFEEENMLQAILSVFSFKPTLITTSRINTFIGLSDEAKIEYSVPKSVYNIEYPLLDFNTFTVGQEHDRPIFSDTNFNFLGFDPITKKVIFTYNVFAPNQFPNQEDLLMNMYKFLNTRRQEVEFNDIASTLIMKPGNLNNLYKNMRPVSVLLSNGMFIVTIPRQQRRIYTNNVFIQTVDKMSINLSPVLFEENITINKVSYTLTGALCYDMLETNNSDFKSLYYVDSQYKIGTYSIIKCGNFWIEYNPNNVLLKSRYISRIEKALRNNFEALYPNNLDNNAYQEWKNSDEAVKITKDILKDKVSIIDMKISDQEAMNKISTNACILIYSESYDLYRLRLENINF
jgi:hypothetical protein